MRDRKDSDRERILVNIAALLAQELDSLHRIPAVQEYMRTSMLHHIQTEWDLMNKAKFNKGDLVVCFTSTGRQQNPYLISFVEAQGSKNDPNGLLLRAIGTQQMCDYGNESFIRITGIHEKFLWEGDKRTFSVKLHKAIAKLDEDWHRFRGLEFSSVEGLAVVYIGEKYGGISERTKPYPIEIKFNKRTTVKNIMEQMKAQGYGTKKFEPMDETYTGPMENLSSFTRESLVRALEGKGIKLKPEQEAKP